MADEIDTLYLETPSETIAVPIFGVSGADDPSAFRIETPSGTGYCETAVPSEAEYPQIRFATGDGTILALDDGAAFDIIFVFDSSGSMPNNSPTTASNHADSIMSGIESDAEYGYVEFNSVVKTTAPLGSSQSTVTAAYPDESTVGSTNISDAMQAAIEEFDANGRSGATPIVIFHSDNKYDTATDGQPQADEIESRGGYVFTIGYHQGVSAINSDPDSDFQYRYDLGDSVTPEIPNVIEGL